MKELRDLGLTQLESNIYLALQELGEAKAGKICEKLKIPNSHIYPTLKKLIEKGLVSYKYANKVKIYKATDPSVLELLFAQKQQELNAQKTQLGELIESLKKLPKNKETASDYQYFEGLRGVKTMISEAYENTPAHSQMRLFSAVSENWETLNAFFLEMHKKRLKRNVSLKMIMQQKTKQLRTRIAERNKIGLIDIRIMDFENSAEILLTQECLLILDISIEHKNPCGFMIQNKVFISLFTQMFDFLWTQAKCT